MSTNEGAVQVLPLSLDTLSESMGRRDTTTFVDGAAIAGACLIAGRFSQGFFHGPTPRHLW